MSQRQEARIEAVLGDVERSINLSSRGTWFLRSHPAVDGDGEAATEFELRSPAPRLRRRVVVQLRVPRQQLRWTFLRGGHREPDWNGKWSVSRDVSAVPDNACTELLVVLRDARKWKEGRVPLDPF